MKGTIRLEDMSKEMLARTEFADGCCFGYYDASFNACKAECAIAAQCERATNSGKVKEVRDVEKRTAAQIAALAEEWK